MAVWMCQYLTSQYFSPSLRCSVSQFRRGWGREPVPHRVPPAQRIGGPGKQRSLIRLRAQEQDAEVEQQEAVLVAPGKWQLQQRQSSTQPQRRQDHEVRVLAMATWCFKKWRDHSWMSSVTPKLTCFPCCPLCSYNRDEMQQQQQAEVLYFSLEKGNVVPQIKHNPWSLKCHQQHLQRMKENAKHRNQYSILSWINRSTWCAVERDRS